MSDASESGGRKAVVDKFTVQAIALTFALGFGGFALKDGYALRLEHESLKAKFEAKEKNDALQNAEIKEWLRKISDKLDRVVEGRAAFK